MDNPEKRVKESCGNLLDDKITGILIGFKQRLVERDGWLDFITAKEATKEIKNLLEEYKGGEISPGKYGKHIVPGMELHTPLGKFKLLRKSSSWACSYCGRRDKNRHYYTNNYEGEDRVYCMSCVLSNFE